MKKYIVKNSDGMKVKHWHLTNIDKNEREKVFNKNLIKILDKIISDYNLEKGEKIKEEIQTQRTKRVKSVSFFQTKKIDCSEFSKETNQFENIIYDFNPKTEMISIYNSSNSYFKFNYQIHISMIIRVRDHLKKNPLVRGLKK